MAGALQDREQEAEVVDLGLTFSSRLSHKSYVLEIEMSIVRTFKSTTTQFHT